MWKKDGKGEESGKRGVEKGVEEGEEKRAKEKRGKEASASAFLAFFYLYTVGFKSGAFFFYINSFLYACFNGRAALVVCDSPRAGAFDMVTGRQRDGTGRERAGGNIF